MKGYRTLIFAALLAAFGAAQVALPAVHELIAPAVYGWATLAISVVVAVLRILTTTPVAEGA